MFLSHKQVIYNIDNKTAGDFPVFEAEVHFSKFCILLEDPLFWSLSLQHIYVLENEINNVVGVLIALLSEINGHHKEGHVSTHTARAGIQVTAPTSPFQGRQQATFALVAQQMSQIASRLKN